MVLITMQAHVPMDQWDVLTRAFDHAMKHRPADVLLGLLVHDNHQPTLWRIMTVWKSQEALDLYYETEGRIPSAHVFHLAGVVPEATVSEVAAFD